MNVLHSLSSLNYFWSIVLRHHFYLPKVIIQVQNDNRLLKRLDPCLKCMELACWVLQASLDQNNYLRQVKMMTKKHLGHQICLCCLASICQASNLNQPPLKAVKMLNFHAFLGPTQVSCLAERSWESGATFFNYINSVETNGITGKIRFEVRKNSIIQINYFQNWYFVTKIVLTYCEKKLF